MANSELHRAQAVRFFDRGLGMSMLKILPGDYYATGEPIALTTVLGSCVAACIWDPDVHVGGMNHFMLPDGGDEPSSGSSGRYGAYAMEVLINDILKLGGRRRSLRAKAFGGGRVLRGVSTLNIGERNARFVLEFLAAEHIPVVATDLEDVCARKVAFLPQSGRALMKRIEGDADESLVRREREYQQNIAAAPVGGDVELF